MNGMALAMLAFAAAPQQLPEDTLGDTIALVSDVVRPASFQPGEIASRVVTLVVPEGVRLEWPDVLQYGGERSPLEYRG